MADLPVIVLAHGAGASSSSPWMRGWTERLSRVGKAFCFDYPYMTAGRRLPDRLPRLVESHRVAIAMAMAMANAPTNTRLVLAGKSMGGRVGCHVALEEPSVACLLCFGYPLISSGKRAAVRDEVLLALRTPVLFVQGSLDPLCPLPRLNEVRARMSVTSELHVVEGGDHSLQLSAAVRRERRTTQAASDAEVLAAVSAYVGAQVNPGGPSGRTEHRTR